MAKFQETEKAVKSLNDLLEQLNKTIGETSSQLIKLNDSTKKQATSSDNLSDKEKQLIATQKELAKLDKQLETASIKLTDEYKKKNAAVLKAKEAVRQQNEEQKKALGIQNRFVGGIKEGVKSVVAKTLAIGALIGGLKSLVTSTIKVTAEFQKYKAVLSTALGSEREAGVEMQNLIKIASKTPFSVQQLTDAYVKLVNQGFKPTTEQMIAMGDLASSTGKGFDQLAEAIIDAQAGEFERLKEFGIKAKKEGDKVTFTFKGVETQIMNTSESINNYIVGLGNIEGVSGSMAKISETLGGQISNLGDNWTQFLNTLGGNSSGVFVTVIGWMNSLVEGLRIASMSIEQMKNEAMDEALKESLIEDEKEVEALAKRYDELGLKTEGLTSKQRAANAILEQYKTLLVSLSDEDKDRKSNIVEQIKALEKLAQVEEKTTKKPSKEEEKKKQKDFEDRIQAEGKSLREQDEFRKSLKFDEVAFIEEMDAQIADINIALNESIKQGQADLTQWNKEQIDKRIEEEKKLLEFKKEAEQELVDIGIESINQLFDLRSSFRDSEIEALEQQKNFEVELAKEKGQSTAVIEDKFAKKEKDLRKKQAIQEKLQTLFNTAINIAEGVVKYASNPITAPLVPAFIALGAVQTGIILATPLPKFFKGTENAPGGPSIVGDSFSGGSQTEYVQLPSGEGFIARNPMVVDLPRGSKVFTENSPETKAALNQFNDKNIVSEIRALRRGISKLSRTDRGYEIYNSETNTTQILRARRFGR